MDSRLETALIMAMVHASTFWQKMASYVEPKVTIVFGKLPEADHAIYQAHTKTLTIHERFADCDPRHLAPLLVHEMWHAVVDIVAIHEPSIQDEYLACQEEAICWQSIRLPDDTGELPKAYDTLVAGFADGRAYRAIKEVYEPYYARRDRKEPMQPQLVRTPSPDDPIVVGEYFRQPNVWCQMTNQQRLRHTALIGLSGSGKSNAMLHWMLQDAKAGRGFVLFDPYSNKKDSLIEQVISGLPEHRLKDVVFLDLGDKEYPFGLNLFDTLGMTADDDLDFRVGQVTDTFKRVWNREAMTMEIWAKVVARTFMANGRGTLLEAQRLIDDPGFRRPFLTPLTHIPSKTYWEAQTSKDGKVTGDNVQAFRSRLMLVTDASLIQNIVGQEETTVDFDGWITGNKIVLLGLPGSEGAAAVRLVGTFLMQRLMAAVQRRKQTDPYYLYMDEFHFFATSDIVEVIGGMRNFGIGLIAATQYLDRVTDPEVRKSLKAVGTTILFQLSQEDKQEYARGLRGIVPVDFSLYPKCPDTLGYITGHLYHEWYTKADGHSYIREGQNIHLCHSGYPDEDAERLRSLLTPLAGSDLEKVYYGDTDPAWDALHFYVQDAQDGKRVPEHFATIDRSFHASKEGDRQRVVQEKWMAWMREHEAAIWEIVKGLGAEPYYEVNKLRTTPLGDVLAHLISDYGMGAAVAKIQGNESLIKTPFVPVTIDHARIEHVRQMSREAYCRPRAEVEQEIASRYQEPATEILFDDPRRPPKPPPGFGRGPG